MTADGGQTPAPRPSVAASGDVITVKVGPRENKYILHKAFLTHYSGYFRGALSGKFSETDEGVVTLKDIDADAFSIFADWIYQQTIPGFPSEWVKQTHNEKKSKADGIMLRSQTYILADRLLVPGLKTAILECAFKTFSGQNRIYYPGAVGVIEVYKNLPDDDPLIRLMIDAQCLSKSPSQYDSSNNKLWKDSFDKLPSGFVAKVAIRLYEMWNSGTTKLDLADYVVS